MWTCESRAADDGGGGGEGKGGGSGREEGEEMGEAEREGRQRRMPLPQLAEELRGCPQGAWTCSPRPHRAAKASTSLFSL